MWKCPACETLNDKDVCVICGEVKPKISTVSYPAPHRSEERESPAYSPEMERKSSTFEDGLDPTPKLEYKPKASSSENSNWGLIATLIILGVIVLLVLIGASNAYAADEGLNSDYHGELTEQFTEIYTSDLLKE